MIRGVVGLLALLYSGFVVLVVPVQLLLYGWDWRLTLVGLGYGTMLTGTVALLRRREWGRRLVILTLFAASVHYGAQELKRQKRPRLYPAPPAQVSFVLALMGVVLVHPSVRVDTVKHGMRSRRTTGCRHKRNGGGSRERGARGCGSAIYECDIGWAAW